MARGPSNTRAISEMGPGGDEECSSTSVSVRRIDNGYVKRVSHYGPDNDYHCTETYSTEKPSLDAQRSEQSQSSQALSRAVAYLKQ